MQLRVTSLCRSACTFALAATVLVTATAGQAAGSEAKGLAAAFASALSLFRDLKAAWDQNVTFPADKEQLLVRVEKLHASLMTLRDAKRELTDELRGADVAALSDRELMWRNRQPIDERIGRLQRSVRDAQDNLHQLSLLLPPPLAGDSKAIILKLNTGLDEKWQTLQDISDALTGPGSRFDPVAIQREGDEAVAIASDLLRAVEEFESSLGNNAG
jgi:hypothetical protein